jgi:hypothetical protein
MKPSKCPRDPNQLAKLITDIATGEVEEGADTAVTQRAKAGGLKGGAARAASLTPDRRVDIARLAAEARWKKN